MTSQSIRLLQRADSLLARAKAGATPTSEALPCRVLHSMCIRMYSWFDFQLISSPSSWVQDVHLYIQSLGVGTLR